MGGIYWLASYPKSGNTWLRVFLTNYRQPVGAPASINQLADNVTDYSRTFLDNWLGLETSDLNETELNHYRLLFQEHLALMSDQPIFAKTHASCMPVAGHPCFSPTATAGAIYLMRNPLDVTVSFAHHLGFSIDQMIRTMADEAFVLRSPTHRMHAQQPGSWSSNVQSWLDTQELRIHVVRYEDLLADPVVAFAGIVRFTGLDLDQTRIRQAVDNARFERLQEQEQAHGFVERPNASTSFFRKGRSGTWRETLTDRQVEQIITTHRVIMERCGYLTRQGEPIY